MHTLRISLDIKEAFEIWFFSMPRGSRSFLIRGCHCSSMMTTCGSGTCAEAPAYSITTKKGLTRCHHAHVGSFDVVLMIQAFVPLH